VSNIRLICVGLNAHVIGCRPSKDNGIKSPALFFLFYFFISIPPEAKTVGLLGAFKLIKRRASKKAQVDIIPGAEGAGLLQPKLEATCSLPQTEFPTQ
jgi:hypothetical protein